MASQTHGHKPHEKMPEHLSTSKKCETREDKIDAQMADTFPASDPPSYSGGNHIIGAPSGRESDVPKPDQAAKAEKQAKSRGSKQ
ncbi:MAG TPA: hypothetical protein VH189_02090 [Rhizomicrobium sp.]|nr:hypothetical protein [Rhizomicrobium sp.]